MSPCGWTVARCGCGKSCWTGYDPAVRDRAEAAAALIMWAATGRRFGLCASVVQPSRAQACADPLYQTYPVGRGHGLLSPVIEGGQWYNRPGSEDGLCCTSSHCEVSLPGPTTKAQITSVTVAGVVVSADAYVVMDTHLLVRIDGECWPACVNYAQQSPPAMSVAYTVGLPIPAAVQGAFERLACEMAKACTGGPCALPQRMTRLTRQGVEIELEQVDNNGETTGSLLTGIKDVDDVILAVNPARLSAAPMVLSPDLPQARRLT